MQSDFDDMDDLWRKAGNEYPLHTGSGDWDKVAAKLGIAPERKGPDRRYLWLLLLLLVPVVCIRPFPLGLGTQQPSASARAGADGAKNSPAPRAHGAAVVTNEHTEKATAGQEYSGEASSRNEATASESPAIGKQSSSGPAAAAASAPVARTSLGAATAAPARSRTGMAPVQDPVNGTARSTGRVATSKGNPAPFTLAYGRTKADRGKRQQDKPTAMQAARPGGPAVPALLAPAGLDSAGVATVPGNSMAGTATVPPVALSADSARTVAAVPLVDTAAANKPAPRKATGSSRKGHFYAGVTGGLGVTSVKGQAVEAPGFDIGAALGYQWGRHLALEANVLWSRKHYYSDGAHLGTSTGYLPLYNYVRSVDGDCRMIEIPVTLRYQFGIRKKGAWFAAAGVSSYLMKREDYGYTIENSINGYAHHYDTTYRNATRDWMALLQLSAGYRFELPRHYSFRVEPYVQLPLRPAGAGRLPLTSAGIRIALLKDISW